MTALLLPQAREIAATVSAPGVVGGMSARVIRAGLVDHCVEVQCALAALEAAPHWNIGDAGVPDDAAHLIVALVLKCCHPGARVVVAAARYEGRWCFPFTHEVDVAGWMPAPPFPVLLAQEGGEQ